MKTTHLVAAAALLAGTFSSAQAADFTLTGTLPGLKDVAGYEFALAATTSGVALWTDSTSATFDPILTVFKNVGGDWLFLDQNDDHGTAPFNLAETEFAGATGQSIGDSTLNFASLDAGRYRVYVSAYSNFALADIKPGELIGTSLSLGWSYVGSDPLNASYSLRANNLPSAPAAVPVPEPATWGLLLAGLGAVGVARRRQSAKA